jgi:hypothetical protein
MWSPEQMDNNANVMLTTDKQSYLERLWSTQLRRPQIGLQDDFFEAGGSSMQVIEMLMTVANEFGRDIDYAEFFADPCIRRLSELLER